ncbi:hypothetical protein ACFOPX_03435 [Helicobacter baculiformis]|uniref:Uncharacterized protein n=1 Tax=Helicobacter baculiformis TaxID=427351 RepID=A0ABV7ZGB1_9HELI|nr:hypothetical protein [Helicobacter baculiformis]
MSQIFNGESHNWAWTNRKNHGVDFFITITGGFGSDAQGYSDVHGQDSYWHTGEDGNSVQVLLNNVELFRVRGGKGRTKSTLHQKGHWDQKISHTIYPSPNSYYHVYKDVWIWDDPKYPRDDQPILPPESVSFILSLKPADRLVLQSVGGSKPFYVSVSTFEGAYPLPFEPT